jgi:hypothetical protein
MSKKTPGFHPLEGFFRKLHLHEFPNVPQAGNPRVLFVVFTIAVINLCLGFVVGVLLGYGPPGLVALLRIHNRGVRTRLASTDKLYPPELPSAASAAAVNSNASSTNSDAEISAGLMQENREGDLVGVASGVDSHAGNEVAGDI